MPVVLPALLVVRALPLPCKAAGDGDAVGTEGPDSMWSMFGKERLTPASHTAST